MNKEYKGKYFSIYSIIKENRKTPIYWLLNNDNFNLGEIKWFPAWRKYCFYPNMDTIWDTKCLEEVIEFMNQINNKRRSDNVKNIKENI